MCGIFGRLSTHSCSSPMEPILAALSHRGPDDSGLWASEIYGISLGHTRLSILDLSPEGAQPMIDQETGNAIVFNGEIYNHHLLRAELAKSGVVFRGTSDTETLLKAFPIWGESLPNRLKGMFAFAIFEKATGRVFIARDRFGIKPLYFHQNERSFFFSSEVRALRILGGLHDRPSLNSISAFLQTGSCPGNRLLFDSIQEFPSACWSWVVDGKMENPIRYWSLPVAGSPIDPKVAVRQIRQLLETSVQEHLLSDVPVSVLLSGGIDSSILTALSAQASTQPVNTFSVGFAEQEFDESHHARMVSARYGTHHHHIQLKDEDVLASAMEAINAFDLPSTDGLNTYIVSKAVVENGFKVALSGLGSDELFGGYSIFEALPKEKFLPLLPQGIVKGLFALRKGRHFLSDLPQRCDVTLADQWWRRCWSSADLAALGLEFQPYREVSPPAHLDEFGKITWTELQLYLHDTLLRDSDVMSMAVSLELRVPFLDHQLVEYVANLPASIKLQKGLPKALLIEACSDLLPPEVYQRKKMGFVLPFQRWMNGPLAEFTTSGQKALCKFLGIPFNPSFFAQVKFSKAWAAAILGNYFEKRL